MPVYGYACVCGVKRDEIRKFGERDAPLECSGCQQRMTRELGAPRFRFQGVPTKGGGPDKFTADMLGIPLHDLPSGLRTTK